MQLPNDSNDAPPSEARSSDLNAIPSVEERVRNLDNAGDASAAPKKQQSLKQMLFLQFNVLVFSLTGILMKFAAQSIAEKALLWCGIWFGLVMLNCAIYAVFWQINLKHFDISIAYLYRTTYIVWNMLWAFFIFGESITLANVLGVILIIIGLVIVFTKGKP